MIRLLAPAWLSLLLLLWPIVRLLPAARPLARGLRMAVFTCCLLALSRPVLRLPSREGLIVAVVDRSASMPPEANRVQQEALARLSRAMPARSRLGVVAFAERAAIEQAPQHGGFGEFVSALDGDGSELAEALTTALALIPPETAARLLVMSDGLHTGADPLDAALPALARGIPIDYRFQSRVPAGDLAVAAFEVPETPRPGETLVLTAWIRVPRPMSVTWRLERDGRRLSEGERTLPGGISRLQFLDTAPESGILRYTLTLPPAPDDPVPENNRARALARVGDERPLLCLSPGPVSGLAELLRRSGLNVVSQPADAFDGALETLAGYRGVLIENVPAARLGRPALASLSAWVRELGGGLMMTGGRQAWGAGGYFGSPLDPLLPLSMEMRREHRKFSLAVMIVLDRSGSMAMPAGTGLTKMDLANHGCVQVLDLLDDGDALGVLAVDTAVHPIVPLAPVETVRAQRDRILGIRSQGGGIYVYTGLRAAAAMLAESQAGARHIILFADAADAEEPGGYIELLEHCRAAGITCSTVGLGSPDDRDADFLRDIAARGGGESYFTDNPDDLPRIFAQDTLAVTRQAFVEEPAPVRIAPGMAMLAATRFTDPPAVGGHNLCYLREGATVGAWADGEDPAPLLAFWQAGAGRVLGFTGEADGDDAGEFARWAQTGDFYASCARWSGGDDPTLAGYTVRHHLEDGRLRVELHPDVDRPDAGPVHAGPPSPLLATLRERPGREPQRERHGFRWTAPDRLSVDVPLRGADTLLAAVRIDGHAPFVLPPLCLPYNPEYRPRDSAEGRALLQRLARAGGGVERTDLAGAWKDLRTARAPRELAPLFALLAALCFLADILERRTGWLSAWRTPSAQTFREHAPARNREHTADAAPGMRPPDRPADAAVTPAPDPPRPPDPLEAARRRARRRLSR